MSMTPPLRTTTLGPLPLHFVNENDVLGIEPHQHYAELRLEFRTLGRLGFPVFQDTVAAVQAHLGTLTRQPFRRATNEDVAMVLWDTLSNSVAGLAEVARYGGEFQLYALHLAVMGVPDHIGHAAGFAHYRIQRPS